MSTAQREVASLDLQVGGNHYKKYKIQPLEFAMVNQLPFIEASVIKYVVRWKDKNGIEDLRKARHMLDVLIEFEQREAHEAAQGDA